jgi:hypothetical protein
VVLSAVEVMVIGYHQVAAQATATPTATTTAAETGTPEMTTTPAATGTMAPTPTATRPPAAVAPPSSYAGEISELEEAPSGHTTEDAQRYYDYIFAQYLEDEASLRTDILWTGPFWIAVWAAVLILFFFFYAYFFQQVHRKEGELYGAVSFAGAIMERIGAVALFSKLLWTGIVLWGLYFIVTHILLGQVY